MNANLKIGQNPKSQKISKNVWYHGSGSTRKTTTFNFVQGEIVLPLK